MNTKIGLVALPLVLLAMAMGATSVNAQYWGGYGGYTGYTGAGYGGWGGWHHWGYTGYGEYNNWYWQARQDGYQTGWQDGVNNNQYDCSQHTVVYCASYGHGYADGQAQYNQNDTPTQTEGQEQQSGSTSYAQSNPNVKVIINNLPSAGAAQNSGTGSQGEPN
jgi:hypothetical protein